MNETCAALIDKWRLQAVAAREEAFRLQRKKSTTGVDTALLLRAEVWDRCADELSLAIDHPPAPC